MTANSKVTGRASTMPGGIGLGAAAAIGITVILAAVIAWLVELGRLKQENIGYGVMLLLLTASYAGAALASAKVKRRKGLVCLLTGVGYFALLLAVTTLFFGGQYSAVGVTALLILAGSGCAALTPALGGKRGRKGRLKRI